MTRWLETDSLSNQDISSALAIGAYTADADRLILVQFFADAVAGNGDYEFYLTHRIGGAGSSYRYIPVTSAAAASGLTAIAGQSGMVAVRSGDVLTLYLDGLAGDTTTPDTIVRWFEADASVTLASTQGAVTFGQVKILASVASEGALHIVNSDADGYGQYSNGSYGQFNLGTYAGERNEATNGTGQYSEGSYAGQINSGVVGQLNSGTSTGQDNTGTSGYGIQATGGTAATNPNFAATGLTAQQVANSLLLAPSGAAADGSVMDYLADTPANVWSYTTRTLTQSSTSTTDSTAAGSIARRRGDSWSISLTIGAITGYTSLWFTAKWDRDNTDAQSVLQIKKNASGTDDGLLYVNGAAATDATKGSITVSDASTGAIVIAVDETITDDLPPAGIYYDVQALVSGTVSTLDSGTLTISADVTRAVL